MARPQLPQEPLGGLSVVGILMSLAGVTCVSQPPAIFDPDEVRSHFGSERAVSQHFGHSHELSWRDVCEPATSHL